MAVILILGAAQSGPEALDKIPKNLSPLDAVLLADPHDRICVSQNADTPLIPASTLKVLTALVVLEHLPPDFRFTTDFFVDAQNNLIVKGYGDPMLISELLPGIAEALHDRIETFNDLVLDGTYFDAVDIPGVTDSYEPYDAPNAALAVNFNTVNFKRRKDGSIVSAEPQTPLLSMVASRIQTSGKSRGRILLSNERQTAVRYAGGLLMHFLRCEGVVASGRIRLGRVDPARHRLIYRFESPFSPAVIVQRLLAYSNNFIANQLLIAAGGRIYGPPATLAKGVRAAADYATRKLGLKGLILTEGAGISRQNRITAGQMIRVLTAFEPYHRLMPRDGRQYYKTGTLSGIHTRAGYIESSSGGLYRFAVLCNSGRSAESLAKALDLRAWDLCSNPLSAPQ